MKYIAIMILFVAILMLLIIGKMVEYSLTKHLIEWWVG